MELICKVCGKKFEKKDITQKLIIRNVFPSGKN